MKKTILPAILILVLGLYLYPSQKFTFEDNYAQKDEILTSLQNFRKEPTHEIEIGGQNWKYYSGGIGDTTILFLHGMGGSYDIWWQQINYFKNKYRIISPTYPPVENLKDLSAGVIAMLDKEKANKIIIVGTSLGGYLAQYLTQNFPDRVVKASFGNTFPPNTIQKAKNDKLTKIMSFMPEWFVIKEIRKKYNAEVIPASENSPIAKAFLNELLGKYVTRKVFLARYYCVVDPFEVKVNPTIPLQIIEADNDPLVEKEIREMLKSTYPQAKVITLHNQGHFSYLSEANQYNKIIEDFIGSK